MKRFILIEKNYIIMCRIMKKLFVFCTFLIVSQLFLAASLFSQELKIPMVKSENSVNSLCWNEDASIFCYTDGSQIIIRDTQTFDLIYTIQTEYEEIKYLQFVKPEYTNSESTNLLFISDTNVLEIRQLELQKNLIEADFLKPKTQEASEAEENSDLTQQDDSLPDQNQFAENQDQLAEGQKQMTQGQPLEEEFSTDFGFSYMEPTEEPEEEIIYIEKSEIVDEESLFILQGNPEAVMTCFTTNTNSTFLAFGYEDGTFETFIFDEEEYVYSEDTLTAGNTEVSSIEFSDQEGVLLTATKDGTITIWNEYIEEISSFEYYPEEVTKVYFTNYADPLVAVTDKTTISRLDLYGYSDPKQAITTSKKILDFQISNDKTTAIILTEDSALNLYDINTLQFIGYLPSFSQSPVTNFCSDNTKSKFLIAHEDNTIFVFEINKVLLPMNSILPNSTIIYMDEPEALTELNSQERKEPEVIIETVPEPAPPEPPRALLRYKNADTVGFRLKGTFIPNPYIIGANFAVGYTNNTLMQPFFFGAYLEPHLGFPQKDFPYKYSQNGNPLSSPLIAGGKIYLPFGITVYPFQENIELFVDLAPGFVINTLWNAKFGKDGITSKLYPGFYGSLQTGMVYKNFCIYMEGNFDAVLGFGFGFGVGYNLNFVMTKKNKQKEEQ